VVLPALEFLERAQVRVRVIERGDEAERDLAAGLVVEEPPAPRAAFGERPTLRVDHPAGFMLRGNYVP